MSVHLRRPKVCSHSIESEEPCGIISVGYDADVSYGHPGGSGLRIISESPPPPAG